MAPIAHGGAGPGAGFQDHRLNAALQQVRGGGQSDRPTADDGDRQLVQGRPAGAERGRGGQGFGRGEDVHGGFSFFYSSANIEIHKPEKATQAAASGISVAQRLSAQHSSTKKPSRLRITG